MNYFLAIFLGIIPSIIWLLFYLRKDAHPESKKMIIKIFFYGVLTAFVAIFAEIGAGIQLKYSSNAFLKPSFFYFVFVASNFIIAAFIEEFLKFLVVREKVLKNPEFDEPVDAMVYMIVAGLGFAALENIFILFPDKNPPLFSWVLITLITLLLRFGGATFLHALCSGTVGYFLALSLFNSKKRISYIVLGLSIATILHALYNYFIINLLTSRFYCLLVIILLMGLSLFVSFGFKKLKKIISICKIY